MLKKMIMLLAAFVFACSCTYAEDRVQEEQVNAEAMDLEIDDAIDELASLDLDDFDDFLEDDDELDAFTSSDLCDPDEMMNEERKNIT